VSERHFTVAEAQAMLPEIGRAMDEIAALRDALQRRVDRIKILDALWGAAVREPGNPDREEFLTERAAVRRTLREIERIVETRIVAQGVRFPEGGLEHGLVDFPTWFQGRTVYLCWQRGESSILAWHEVDGGFKGRRPLTPEQARLMGRDRGN
jgi:hypothetical protein